MNKKPHTSWKADTSDCILIKNIFSWKDEVKIQAKNWEIFVIQPNRLIDIKWSVRTLTNYLEKKVTQFKNGEKPGAGISKKKKTTQIS